MDKERTIVELKAEIIKAFSDVPHPGSPEKIYPGPCCPEHDAWAEWMSRHTWRDLEEDLETDDPDLTGYSNFFPAAYRYFLQAVLIYIIQNIHHDPDGDRWGTRAWRPMDRVYHTIVLWARSEKKWMQDLRRDHLPSFSIAQRKIVVRVLEFVCAFGFIPDEDKAEIFSDIQTAIKDLWGSGI